MLFIIVCLLFSFSRSLLDVFCIFSILFTRFGSSLLPLLWILFQVDCLFPLHLFGLMGFYLAPSSAVYFSVFSFHLTYCVWGLLFTGCVFMVPVVFRFCPQWLRLVQLVVDASWWRGLLPVFWWMRLDLVFLLGRTTSSDVFSGVCDVIMILDSLSANGWGCAPVLLVVWHKVSITVALWSLSLAGSLHWDGDLWESFRHLILCRAGRSLVD